MTVKDAFDYCYVSNPDEGYRQLPMFARRWSMGIRNGRVLFFRLVERFRSDGSIDRSRSHYSINGRAVSGRVYRRERRRCRASS